MKKILLAAFSSMLIFTGCVNQHQQVNNNTEEQRIIATSLATCQILDKLNIDLIGVPTTSGELPERYKGLTEVGAPMGPDLEIIKLLNPTDVIGPNTLEESLKDGYDSIGVNSTFINLRNIEKMYEDIMEIGEKYNKQEEAEILLNDFNEFMANLEINEENSPKVLVLMGMPGAYVVATEHSYIGNLVSLAGGENIFTDDTEAFLNINPEEMLERQPDIILRASHALPEQVMEMFAKEFEENDIWKYFEAVQNGRVYDLDYTLFGMSATLEYPKALEILYEIFYEN